jgi:hypothetical protein
VSAFEVLALNTSIPQIQAAQAGDSYVMVVNATTPALRITQTGTGNALEVEDSANPDATPFVVDATGNVGIGTNAPLAKLHVAGEARFVSGAATQSAITITQGFINGDISSANFTIGNFGDNSSEMRVATRGFTTFFTGATNNNTGTERMRLDSSGNLGLGVTPSAWDAAGAGGPVLQIQRALLFGANTETRLIHNAYYGIGDFRYIASGVAATNYQQQSGQHRWFTAPSGTAGDPISFTQVLTLDGIDGSGYGKNLKLGGTADRATTKGTHHFDIFDGTAPVGTLANGISLYSSSGEAYVMDAAGNATLFSPHDSETNEWIFKSKHTPSGKVLKIDVEKMLRFINDHFGLDAIHEFTEE